MTWTAVVGGRTKVGACCAAALGLVVLSLALAPAAAYGRLQLGLQDPGFDSRATPAEANAAYNAVAAFHGSFVRVPVNWASIEPVAGTYRWAGLDSTVDSASRHHLAVIIQFFNAPTWAQGPGPQRPYVSPGAWDPNPTAFADFVRGTALRYSGSSPDPLNPGATLPRVRYWEIWNEPNIPGYFSAPDPVSAYRALLDGAYGALKGVHPDNVVATGGLAPISPVPGSTPALDFAADLLCLHRAGGGFRANRQCPQRAEFDVFAIHPYSLAATPTKRAYKSGDVLVGDMPEVGALIGTADRLHTASPRIHHRIWVTEFAWPTNPPDPQLGDSPSTAARYVAYSMYEMWRSGVSLVIWLWAIDTPADDIPGGALYAASGAPKLTEQAFAFPVVAGVSRGHGFAWGRVPVSGRARVVVERAVGRRWRAVARLTIGSDGTFYVGFPAHGNGLYRARVIGGPTSLPYNSKPIPPRRTHAYNPF